MRSRPQLRVVAFAVFVFILVRSAASWACLRDSLDDRAVQWSSQIVMANLTAIDDPQPINPNSPDGSMQFQTYDFSVTTSLDGPAKAGDKVVVIRFITGADSQKSSICGQAFTPTQLGKSFLLLLRPEADLAWSDRGSDADPRTAQIHAMKAFVVVHLDSAHDLGSDGLDDAKYTISSTRAAEAQFKADDAKLQVQTMIDAADDTEESQAEHALMDMGPKVLPVLRAAMAGADPQAQGRLQRVIRSVSPPSIMASVHQH
jgi:hypothetical protein